MSRLFTDKEIKAIMKALMVVWQENDSHEQLGLNVGNDLLCKVEVCEKMESLLTNKDNYEYHLHESEWFDENVAELLEAYHTKKQQEQVREQGILDLAKKIKAQEKDGNLVLSFEDNLEQEQEQQ